MKIPTLSTSDVHAGRSTAGTMPGPIRDGIATIDQLLAELNPNDGRLCDAVLDLRLQSSAASDAEACAAQLFRVAELLGDRHYEAFFRVRCWAARTLCLQVRTDRNATWLTCAFPLNCDSIEGAAEAAIALLVPVACHRRTAAVRFAFATTRRSAFRRNADL